MPPIGKLRITPIEYLGISDWRAQEGLREHEHQYQLECYISPPSTKGLLIKLFEATPTRTLISAIWEILGVSRFIGEKVIISYHQGASIEVQKL